MLRIDGNFYDSYQDALYYLYPLVPVGGWVIFDDISALPFAKWLYILDMRPKLSKLALEDMHQAMVALLRSYFQSEGAHMHQRKGNSSLDRRVRRRRARHAGQQRLPVL